MTDGNPTKELQDLYRRFDSWTVDAEQLANMEKIKKKSKELAQFIFMMVPKGRYQSMALTALEETAAWATKGIAHASEKLEDRAAAAHFLNKVAKIDKNKIVFDEKEEDND